MLLTCWWCGTEPDEVTEVRSFEGVVRRIPHWPASDHDCAETPPSADMLLDRVLLSAAWTDA